MIWFFTPYSFEKKLFEAYDNYMMLINDPDDWGCLMDGDMAFLMSDFGKQIQEYIDKYPGTALFTCYASRCPYAHQIKYLQDCEKDSIQTVFRNTIKSYENDHLKVINQNRRIAGHLMVIQKKTWLKYREDIGKHAVNANIQAVDTAISDVFLKNNERILLMEGMHVFHYYRQYSMTEKHILSDKLTVVIRTHERPAAFKRCIDSVRKQTHQNIEIVVGVDTPASLEYAQKENPTKIIELQGRERLSHQDFPPNEYISKLISHIYDGYILILDDDNYLDDPKGIEKLFNSIDKELCIYMIRYHYPDGRLFPTDAQFKSKQIKNGGVDWASCVFHARFNNVAKTLPLYNADYYFINALVSHCKVQKWIDLPLVHTDTPGNDGKTEEQLNKPKGSTDVVYVLGSGSKWGNNEIRFSIRSFEKHFKDLRNIVVVGECPEFLTNVIHISCEDKKNVNKDARMGIKIKAACNDYRVSDNFILCTDDIVLLRDLTAADFTGWHDGPIAYNTTRDLKEHKGIIDNSVFHTVSDWYGYVYATGKELKKRGFQDNNYDRAHCPQPINKKEFIDVLSTWNMDDNYYTISNIYNNSTSIFSGQPAKNAKLYNSLELTDINEITKDKDCINYNDNGLNHNFKEWLNNRFPQPTMFEVFSTESDKRTAVQDWFEHGCNYEDGVRIFKHFAPRNRLLIKFFESKRNNELTDKKLKNTLQIWLR